MTPSSCAPDARAQLAAMIFAVLLLDEEDRIVEANGRTVDEPGDLAAALAEGGGAVLLVVERRGAQVLVDIPLR